MAPWNKAAPANGGSSAYTESPTRRPLRSAASRSNLSQPSHQQQHSAIRSVPPPSQQQDDRPPSFHSQGYDGQAQYAGDVGYREEEYYAPDGEEHNPYSGYASPTRGPTPASQYHQPMYLSEADVGAADYRQVGLSAYDYAPRTEVDMELRLDQGAHYAADSQTTYHNPQSAPTYYNQQGPSGQQHYDDGYYDDGEYDEKDDQFEDSFEGPAEQWREDDLDDEKRTLNDEEGEAGLESPAISFAGGFGAPPTTAHHRRNLRATTVALTSGNLVIDCPLPPKLLKTCPRKGDLEYATTRYTAVTHSPDEFARGNYQLRPRMYGRQTELFIVVTMYNEGEVLFTRTMHGIAKNIAHLCRRKNSSTWGEDGWKKVVICVVADGRKAVNARVLDCLGATGVYQEAVMTNEVDGKDVQAHLFEHTTQWSLASNLTYKGLEHGIVPMQVMFCLKEKNAKKLNSHRWALQAFAPQLDPNVCILIDAGTKPKDKSIYLLWKAFDRDSNVGGACGEICAMKGKFWTGLANPLVAAQNFEYKISNILDKPTESFFGYITVLPGAFSAYRYVALKNDELGHGPLASYFKGEHLAGHDADVFTSNMYLAEDRILCWELVAKKGESWVLKYVAGAQGETDVPDNICEFISQRRRWLNGSFFASAYAIRHTFQLQGTEHSRGKKVALYVQAMYNVVNLLFSWFALANYWIFFMVLTTSLEDKSFGIKGIKVVNKLVQYAYMGNIVACFIFSMGNKPQSSMWKYMASIVIFGLTTAYMIAAAVFCLYKAIENPDSPAILVEIVISLASTYGCYVFASLIALDPWHLLTSFAQYMIMSPVYINLFNIYAFSNLDDFSWGTKGATSNELDLGVSRKVGDNMVETSLPSDAGDINAAYDRATFNLKTRPMIPPPPRSQAQLAEDKKEYYASVRTNVLLAWVLTNALLVVTILQGDYSATFSSGNSDKRVQVFVLVVLVFVAVMAMIRFVGSTGYQIDRAVRNFGGQIKSHLARRQDAKRGKPVQRVGRGIGSESVAATSVVGTDDSSDR